MIHPLYWQNYMYSKLHACTWTTPRNSARSRLTRLTSSATVCYAACRINVHVHCILNSWAYQSHHATENWKKLVGTKFSDVKKCFWFLCRITYYTVRFFPHSHRFSLLFTKAHVGQEECVIDERILKEMHYTGTIDLGTIYANVRHTEAVICEVFYWNYR